MPNGIQFDHLLLARRRSEPTSRRSKKLRAWRNAKAQELGIDSDRVFTNRSLKALVLAQPETYEELAKVEGMEEWRMSKFGQALWDEFR